MRNAVQLICSKMVRSANPWFLEGEVSLALQGAAISGSSLRIVTDRLGAYELGEHLQNFGKGIISKRDGAGVSYRGEFNLFNVPLEVIGDWQIEFGERVIPVPAAEIYGSGARADMGDYEVPVTPLAWQLFLDLLTGASPKRIERILEEEPDRREVNALVERFGLYLELRERLRELFEE